MKFKKVEISAFRIYDNPEDATFNFITPKGDVADFVSLYAPNGFGKTSFYDAVEWGMTNCIGRLLKKNEENEKLTNAQFEGNTLSIIKRINSENETYVKITPDDGKEVLAELKVNKRSKSDIKFNDESNKSFHKVILSQEWISAFLKEDDGELRYQKFIRNPELIEVDKYYKNLIGLINENKKKIKELQDEIEDARQNIKEFENSNLLEYVNRSIKKLSNLGEKLDQIHISTTQKELVNFRNKIVSRSISIEQKKKGIEGSIALLNEAKNGSQNILGLKYYFEKSKQIENYNEELKCLGEILQKFNALETLSNQKDNILVARKALIENKDLLILVLEQFPEYKNIQSLIDSSRLELKDEEQKAYAIDQKVNVLKMMKSKLDVDLESINEQIVRTVNWQKKIPELNSSIAKLNIKLPKIEQRQKSLAVFIGKEEKDKNLFKTQIEEYNQVILAINKNDYTLIKEQDFIHDNDLLKFYKKWITENKNRLEQLEKIYKRQEGINDKICQQEAYNSNISEFVKKGLEIVTASQTSKCPLCSSTYKSFEDLANSISNNDSLDKVLRNLLAEKTGIENNINELKNAIKKVNDALKNVYSEHVLEKNKNLNECKIKIERFNIEFQKNEKILENLNSEKEIYLKECNNLSIDALEVDLQNKLLQLNPEKIEKISLVTENENQIVTLNKQLKIIKNQKNLLIGELEKYLSNKKYVVVNKWFKENHSNSKIHQNIIATAVKENAFSIEKFSIEIIKLDKAISGLKNELSSNGKDAVLKQKENIQGFVLEAVKAISLYRDFTEKILKKSIQGIESETLSSNIELKGLELKKEKTELTNLGEEYKKLNEYGKILEPHLQSEQTRLELNEKEKELQNWEEKVKPLLEEEREKLKEYLNEKIENFFFTDLINKIYKKIDPHPDFKKVEFKVNFESDNPRLDVFVSDSDNMQKLIPNLYFSTAQLNILSLGIFLASALNSNKYDCIFIDDPIQSMDSINILSVVDLLRSITVNLNKQIILSTHDENFHNLLKKKIPKETFKSKFLKLETFGTVKEEL